MKKSITGKKTQTLLAATMVAPILLMGVPHQAHAEEVKDPLKQFETTGEDKTLNDDAIIIDKDAEMDENGIPKDTSFDWDAYDKWIEQGGDEPFDFEGAILNKDPEAGFVETEGEEVVETPEVTGELDKDAPKEEVKAETPAVNTPEVKEETPAPVVKAPEVKEEEPKANPAPVLPPKQDTTGEDKTKNNDSTVIDRDAEMDENGIPKDSFDWDEYEKKLEEMRKNNTNPSQGSLDPRLDSNGEIKDEAVKDSNKGTQSQTQDTPKAPNAQGNQQGSTQAQGTQQPAGNVEATTAPAQQGQTGQIDGNVAGDVKAAEAGQVQAQPAQETQAVQGTQEQSQVADATKATAGQQVKAAEPVQKSQLKELPDTGEAKPGLIGGFTALLAGLGLLLFKRK